MCNILDHVTSKYYLAILPHLLNMCNIHIIIFYLILIFLYHVQYLLLPLLLHFNYYQIVFAD